MVAKKSLARRMKMGAAVFLLGGLVVLSTGCAYNLMAERAMRKDAIRFPRHPDSLVIKGVEEVTLEGPSRNAALLVHGFVGSRVDFNDLGKILNEKGLTVRMMRLPGHGTFSVDHAITTEEEYIQALVGEYQSLKESYDQVALIAFSMGGAISILASDRIQFDRMVLIAPYFGVEHRWYYGLPAETWNSMMSWLIPYVVKSDRFTCVNRPEAKKELFYYRVVSTQGAAVLIEMGKKARRPEALARLNCPVLILHSTGDQAASFRRSEKAFELIASKDKRFVRYEDSNHHILWDFDREAAKQEIVGFLEPLWKTGEG